VLAALEELAPQCLLIEGPPDADEMIAWMAHAGMQPPVALLVYQTDDAKQAAFFPLAEFSPEWCAARWALQRGIPVRFMDLPQAHALPLWAARDAKPNTDHSPADEPPEPAAAAPETEAALIRRDPLQALAQAAGFDDGERWWEHTIEHRLHNGSEVFTAIREAMLALRERTDGPTVEIASDFENQREALREAWMRRTLRAAQKEYENIAVLCGAWHAPALEADVLARTKKEDEALLKKLAKVKTTATWVPWTYRHLASASGYGAGVTSPGWYEHLWQSRSPIIEHWMTRVARLLRDSDVDCSSAHVIEATRLAKALAALRGRPLADLSDIADATRAVFCFDSDVAMRLIAERLLVGDRLGAVPAEVPLMPLQEDLQREQKRLRLKPEALEKTLDLDLRNETDLARSQLLHRLRILGIDWGTPTQGGRSKGTFHELWNLRWDPVCLVKLVELGAWGNTIAMAASAWVRHTAEQSQRLEDLTRLLDDVLLANLPEAVEAMIARILATASVGADAARLMDALIPLAGVLRYGNVRQTDQELVRRAIDGIFPRLLAGLPGALSSLNDEAAAAMAARLVAVHEGVHLLDRSEDLAGWLDCLERVANGNSTHGLVSGRAARLLFDDQRWSEEDVARRLSQALSPGTPAATAAAWVEGFLHGSGLVLLHHHVLLDLIDDWACEIPADAFVEQLPLLRRTFATFSGAERRQIAQRLSRGAPSEQASAIPSLDAIDHARAARVLPALKLILGSGPENRT
jgi:hypothetical protein